MTWVALEGGEGSGKSTQARLLADRLGAVLTREPGGTEVGAAIRQIVLDPHASLADRTEALLMAADRAQHVCQIVAAALARGEDVVSDRSAWSHLAYQGYGRGLDVDELYRLSDWATEGRWPDVAILIDVDPAEAEVRMAGRTVDRFEQEDRGFHARVRKGFHELAERWPERWVVIDGSGTIEAVAARIAHHL